MPKANGQTTETETTASSAVEQDSQQIDANTEVANGAESSSVEGQQDAKDEKQTLLSVVQDVLKPKVSDEGDSSAPGEDGKNADGKSTAEGDEGKTPEAKAEDDAKLPFHNHPRWKEVLAENRSLKEPAEIGKAVQTYQETTGVDSKELNELLHVGNLGKNDPEKAIPLVEAYLAKLKGYIGETLPDDLAQKVKDGYMDEETARQASKDRATAKRAEERVAKVESRQETDNARAAVQGIAGAVNTWEQQQIAKNPDYAKIKPLVHAFVSKSFQENGRPATKEAAIKVAEDALVEVTKTLKPLVPTNGKTTIKNIPSTTGKTAVASQPKTMLDAVKGAIGK